jgi:hypothetical protein
MAVACPRCKSTSTTRNTRGSTVFGTPSIWLTCLQCGHQWRPGTTGKGSCGGCLILILLGGFLSFVVVPRCSTNNPNPTFKAPSNPSRVPNNPQPEQNPIPDKVPENNPPNAEQNPNPTPAELPKTSTINFDGYRQVIGKVNTIIPRLRNATAQEVAAVHDDIGGIWQDQILKMTDQQFGEYVIGLTNPQDKQQELDRVVAEMQVALVLVMTGKAQKNFSLADILKEQRDLTSLSTKLNNLLQTYKEPQTEEVINKSRWHTWTSADGKFTTEAKFVKAMGDIIYLEKQNGKSIQIQRDKLSDKDLYWIKHEKWKSPDE